MPPRGAVCGGGTRLWGGDPPFPLLHISLIFPYIGCPGSREDGMAWTAIRNGRLLLIGGCAAAALATGAALRADLMVSHGFNTAPGKGLTSFTAPSQVSTRATSPV